MPKTCANTVAASHVNAAASRVGAPSETAELRKKHKYSQLSDVCKFTPVAIETLGPCGPEAAVFMNEIGKRLSEVTGDPRSAPFLNKELVSLCSGETPFALSNLFRQDLIVTNLFISHSIIFLFFYNHFTIIFTSFVHLHVL